jgi:hypothetical protein
VRGVHAGAGRARGASCGTDGIVRGDRPQRLRPVHIVIAAWLFVIGTMALTFASALGGAAFFAAAGVAPVAFYAWVKLRRLRMPRSVREQGVDDGDDADARGDQR